MTTIIIIASVLGTGIFMFLMVWIIIRGRTINNVSYFIADEKYPVFHILGAEYVMPDEGESYEVYKHYIFSQHTLKFEMLSKQQGKGIDLESPFIKRSLEGFAAKYNETLRFGLHAVSNEFTVLRSAGKIDPVFTLHYTNWQKSDTEVAPKLDNNCLVFEKRSESDLFNLTLRKGGREVATHKMRGLPDVAFFGFIDSTTMRLYFTYLKKRGLKYGVGLCVLQYETGELVFDEFVR